MPKIFKLGDKIIPNSNPTNKYKLIINNMSGDGDSYHKTITLLPEDHEPLIKSLIELCEWSSNKWPSRDKIEERYMEDIMGVDKTGHSWSDHYEMGQFMRCFQ